MSETQTDRSDSAIWNREAVYQAFAEYRSYVKHEDALINERLQRLLIIEGFLFTAEATLLPKWGELLPKLISQVDFNSSLYAFYLYGLFLIVVPLVGIVAAAFVRPALQAARAAIEKLGKDWKDKCGTLAEAYLLPELLGGGAAKADEKGHRHIVHITWCFIGLWGFFCVGTLWAAIQFYLNHLRQAH